MLLVWRVFSLDHASMHLTARCNGTRGSATTIPDFWERQNEESGDFGTSISELRAPVVFLDVVAGDINIELLRIFLELHNEIPYVAKVVSTLLGLAITLKMASSTADVHNGDAAIKKKLIINAFVESCSGHQ